MVKPIKARSYVLQIEANGFFQKDQAVLDALIGRFTSKGHTVIDAEIDESSKPVLGHRGSIRLLTLRTYPQDYDFSHLATETQVWLAESFTPAQTAFGETRFSVTVKSLELRYDLRFDDAAYAPSLTELEEIGMDADGAKA